MTSGPVFISLHVTLGEHLYQIFLIAKRESFVDLIFKDGFPFRYATHSFFESFPEAEVIQISRESIDLSKRNTATMRLSSIFVVFLFKIIRDVYIDKMSKIRIENLSRVG